MPVIVGASFYLPNDETWYRIGTDSLLSAMLGQAFAAVDTEKFVEYSMQLAEEFGGSELGISDTEMRRPLRPHAPATIEYWVDDRGRIIKQALGDQVTVNSKFGKALDIPEIPASQIEEFPAD